MKASKFKALRLDGGDNLQTRHIHPASGIRLRKEFFGGLVYDTRSGTTLEVDQEAFQLLYTLKYNSLCLDDLIDLLLQNKAIKNRGELIEDTVKQLIDLDIIQTCSPPPQSPHTIQNPSVPVYKKPPETHAHPWLTAPETVHWAVTYRCDADCPDCYTRRFSHPSRELTTGEALKLIDRIAQWGVFQLAVGGGEPFAREDLPQLVSHASAAGLSVHVTTGRYRLQPGFLDPFAGAVTNLNFGLPPHLLAGPARGPFLKQFQTTAALARDAGLLPGANIVLTQSVIQQLESILEALVGIGINRFVLLRYKPPASLEQWETENPMDDPMKELHGTIDHFLRRRPGVNLRVDCALSFVQRHLPVEVSAKLGIKGCVAADRILAVAPDASVYPCSQLVHPRCYAGNLLEYDPSELWNKSRNLRRYRLFRDKKTFKYSRCGICRARAACGGCRVFAGDALGGDPGCPEPIHPEISELGKIGRAVDYPKHAARHGELTAKEYAKHYSVGQRTAEKEIKKYRETHRPSTWETIWEIQDLIGRTSGGFPYATTEQIAEWTGLDAELTGYPAWINEDTVINRERKILVEPRIKKKKKKTRRKKK